MHAAFGFSYLTLCIMSKGGVSQRCKWFWYNKSIGCQGFAEKVACGWTTLHGKFNFFNLLFVFYNVLEKTSIHTSVDIIFTEETANTTHTAHSFSHFYQKYAGDWMGWGALFVLHAKIPLAVRYLSVCIFHAQFLNISVGFKLKLTRSSRIFFDWICSYANADETLTCNSLIEKKFFLAFVTCRSLKRESQREFKNFFSSKSILERFWKIRLDL